VGGKRLFGYFGILRYKWIGSGKLAFLPYHLRNLVISRAHNSVVGRHFAKQNTIDKIRMLYFWPGVTTQIEFVRKIRKRQK
jgi:hypothetical protein